MKNEAKKKILFFISGSVPSEEESKKAKKIDEKVCFRNALFIDPKGCLEYCDFVMGDIPESYSEIPIFGGKNVKEFKKETEAGKKGSEESSKSNSDEQKKVDVIWKPNP